MCKKDVLGNIKWQKQYLAFFLAIIYDVEHFFVGLNAKNNGFKWEENQFYYFYPSEGDHSWKIENDNIQENTPIWGKLRLLLDSATQSYSEKTTVIKIAR